LTPLTVAVLTISEPDAAAWAVLDAEERSRAEAFRFERDRRSFVAAHAALRLLLEEHYGRPAAAWRFARETLGRPVIADPPPGRDPRISLTHTHGLAAAAVCEGREIGVDAERIDPARVDPEALDAFLAAEEAEVVRATPAAERVERFFAFWTLREALLKARGLGLTQPLSSFALALSPDRLTRTDPALLPRGIWRFERRRPSPEHLLALAFDAPLDTPLDLRFRPA
jgi:4'-phosphopantetheinyl transferase